MSRTLTLLVTHNAPGRYTGFLASCMLPIAPNVFLAPRLPRRTRDHIWSIMLDWREALPPDGSVLMAWTDTSAPSGLHIRTINLPRQELHTHDGLWLTRTDLTTEHNLDDY